jgi:hypothetical protein
MSVPPRQVNRGKRLAYIKSALFLWVEQRPFHQGMRRQILKECVRKNLLNGGQESEGEILRPFNGKKLLKSRKTDS